MRFIGNKEKLVDKIFQIMSEKGVRGDSFFDVFSGTTSVAQFFKRKGYETITSDLLYFSYVLQQAYIVNNKEPQFDNLLKELDFHGSKLFASPLSVIVEYLNQIPPVEGFIYHNYTPKGTRHLEQPRMYFSNENGQIIDAIRKKIEEWKNEKLINSSEYYILLACLIETVPFYANITGVYAAFQKKWDPRAIKRIELREIQILINKKKNYAYNENSVELAKNIDADIFYLDPPYNQRQYAPNYHLLETIAKYDNPSIKGVTGLRDYSNQKSAFCNSKTGISELEKIAKNARCKFLIMSYNSEGIMPQEEIQKTLSKYGRVELVDFKYLRFKSNNNGDSKHKKHIKEQLYILNKFKCKTNE
jgi:adenine-specific DNA-methyltransferase